MDAVDEFLMHNGVKGMHWGVRKAEDSAGPRQSHAEKVQVKREGRAQKYVNRANKAQEAINALNTKQYKTFIGRNSGRKQIKDLEKVKKDALNDAERKRKGKLSKSQRNVVIGAAVVGAIIAAVAIHESIDSGEFNRMSMKGEAFLTKKRGGFNKNPVLMEKNMSVDKVEQLVVKHVNPGYGAYGTKQNCRRCTFAYELRRRGFDVEATRTNSANGQNAVGLLNALSPGDKIRKTSNSSVYRQWMMESVKSDMGSDKATPISVLMKGVAAGGKDRVDSPSAQSLFNHLSKQPNGSRGELAVMWKMGGGHSMAYEIFDGKPVIFDNQTGAALKTIEDFAKHGLDQISEAGTTRLDNVNLNTDYLMRWMKNAK